MPLIQSRAGRLGAIAVAALLLTSVWAQSTDDKGTDDMTDETVVVETGEFSLPLSTQHLPLIEAALRQAVNDTDALQRWNIPEIHFATLPITVDEAYVSEGDGRVLIGDWALVTDGAGLRAEYTPLSENGARQGIMFTADLVPDHDLWIVHDMSLVRLK